MHPAQSNNPIAKRFKSDLDKYGTVDQGFNIICTTYRLTEHYHYWTKNNPYNMELQPEFFCEVSPELAAERGLEHNGWATIITARAAGAINPTLGEVLRFAVRPEHVHLFDRTSGLRI